MITILKTHKRTVLRLSSWLKNQAAADIVIRERKKSVYTGLASCCSGLPRERRAVPTIVAIPASIKKMHINFLLITYPLINQNHHAFLWFQYDFPVLIGCDVDTKEKHFYGFVLIHLWAQ